MLTNRILSHLALLPFIIFAVFPFYHMALTSLKQNRELYDRNAVPLLITQGPTLEHYTKLLWETEFINWTKNSLMVTVLATVISLVIGTVAAYALARLKFFAVGSLGTGIFVTYLVPPTLLFLPLSRLITVIGLQDSIWSLVVVYPGFTIPLSTWLLMGFLRSVPRDIEEQAQVDGYSRLGAVVRTVFPLALPGIFTVVVFTFTLTMQDFIYALAFVSSSSSMTVSVGVPTVLIRGDVFYWQSLMASAIIVAVPVALLYNVFLGRFIRGFTLGAVKG